MVDNSRPIKSIETPRLFIIPTKIDYLGALWNAIQASINEVSPWLSWANPNLTQEQLKNFILYAENCQSEKIPNNLFFSIFEKTNNKYIGDVYYGSIDWDIPYFSIGYWIDSRDSGKGYMTEAVNGLTRVAFKYFEAKRVEISMSNENILSKKIPERLGFSLEGVLKNHHINFVTRKVSDTLMYSRTNISELSDIGVNCIR